ncbi:MAG: nuclear transport factor 2 family protein [Paracoccus sp. (in: a-proteobacteria)]|uniref:nuclear transport factor 2 family protein n=1 Tax=Paracoccus sp. TaxID=267 RepID=UPI0026DFAE70|nr:nuclear transport factor 2 family protein [Paracoccus sp. (in: a-proteobacteria)]MDO5614077.1 nuclear transport factor 2 family protein [Paracoccus sp. (in: a-proteobacteria)]
MTDAALTHAFAAFTDAMLAGDAQAIRALTAPDFTLTHITGYVQPREEWLAQMAEGQFVYHSITPLDVTVTATPPRARLVARTMTDARIYGGRNNWRLQLDNDYARQDGAWILRRSLASVWNERDRAQTGTRQG